MTRQVEAVVAKDTRALFTRGKVPIRDCGDDDVEIDIHWAGICHSDYHTAKAEWPGPAIYPMVPGHEIAGIVVDVGKNVKKFKKGDKVGVGCMIDSCRKCDSCKNNLEQFCVEGMKPTYNASLSEEYQKKNGFPTNTTYGGYSQKVVVKQHFVVTVPDSIPFEMSAPLLCAGITTFSPLVRFGAKEGGKNFRTAIIGLGGLGDMGAKLAKAMGNKVTVVSTSEGKKDYAEKQLGVDFICTGRELQDKYAAASANGGKFDLMLCTAPKLDDITPYMMMLAPNGKFCVIGVPADNVELNLGSVLFGNKSIVSSLIGGMKETQEMLDFCAEHQLWSEAEVIKASEVNRAYQELGSNTSKKQRFVIDVKNSMTSDGAWEVSSEKFKDTPKHTVNKNAKIIGAENTAGKTYDPKTGKFE